MKRLAEHWRIWAVRLDALSFRERVLVFLAVAGAAMSLLFVGLTEPALKQQSLMLQTISDVQQEIFALREQLDHADGQGGHDPELQRLEAQAAAIEQTVKARERGLVEPVRMIATLKSLLAGTSGLKLLALETGATRPALAADGSGGETPPPAADSFYQHGITLRIEGGYADLTDYLARLEKLPWTVQWEAVRIDASRHPRLELTLKIHTLSREPMWARL